ncbi:DsbA family protein [Catenulispora pinisilvae]|uniref:DsbA family protein n=1 Tax=Catenulispora pinisilvae TaxID=2705253 RepID=UPI00189208CA|nr:thioredoxin domain-containing protein [Catenulispora pinisilvae]
MTQDSWEDGLREIMTGTAGKARVAAAPTDVILRRGRSSVRWRNGLAGSAVLGAVAAAVIAGTAFASGTAGSPAQPGAAASPGRLPAAADAVVTLGSASAKTKVVIYDDYRCPPCRQVDSGTSALLKQETASGKVEVEYRPVDLIDRDDMTNGTGSVVAGNAVQCAADQGDFLAYRAAVFAHQPASDAQDPFNSPSEMISIARGIPGLVTPSFVKCVDDQPYAAAIRANYDTAINTLHCPGVPCINAGGQQWNGQGIDVTKPLGASVDTWLSQIIGAD